MTFSDTPVLSVIVPSRNRARYAKHCIENVLALSSTRVQCVVLDNSDNDELEDEVRRVSDPRLRYAHVDERLTLSSVFEEAYRLSTGAYVTFIGDDDGVLADIAVLAEWMEENEVDSASTPLLVSYGWNDFQVRFGFGFHRGEVVLRHYAAAAQLIDIEYELRHAAENSFQDFSRLPKLYYGIVRRSVIETAIRKAGRLFWGASPDISGSMAVSSYVKTHVLVDYPVFIGGSSGASAAGRSGRNRHYNSLESEPHTKEFAETWPARVPPFFAEETVWAHAALLTLEKHGRDDIIAAFDGVRLYGKSLGLSPWRFKPTIASAFRKTFVTQRQLHDAAKALAYAIRYTGRRALTYGYRASRVGYLWKYEHWFKGANNVAEAGRAIDSYLSEQRKSIKQALATLAFEPNKVSKQATQ